MRPTKVSVAAVGNTPWVLLDYLQLAYNVGLAVTFQSGSSLTVGVQFSLDGPDNQRSVAASQSTTTITVTDTGSDGNGHGLSVGDDVVLTQTGVANMDGEYAVASVVDATHYTLTSGTSQTATATINAKVQSYTVFNHATLTTLTARAAGVVSFPVRAVRLNCSLFTSGRAWMEVIQGDPT